MNRGRIQLAAHEALNYWVDRINQGDLAILAGVVRRMQAIVADDDASMAKISQTILSDAGLTTKVLKMANSVAYSQQAGSVTTVSRACILLGVENLRNITLSVRIIDDLLQQNQQQPLLRVLAKSLQTALLARTLWGRSQPRQAEEAFIAGLLMDLGEAAYFSLQDSKNAQLINRWNQGEERDQVTRDVLGITFRELGRELAKSWNLGGLTQEVMKPVVESNVAKVVTFCHRLSESLIQHQKPEEIKIIYQKLGALLKKDIQYIAEQVQESLETLPELIHEFGAEILLSQYDEMGDEKPRDPVGSPELALSTPALSTPVKAHEKPGIDLLPEIDEEVPAVKAPLVREADSLLQLNILREMILIDNPRAHINTLVSMTLEGLYRGVAMDRALIAVLSLDGRVLSARLVLGESAPEWRNQFRFDVKDGEMPVFAELMLQRKCLWMGQGQRLNAKALGRGAERIYPNVTAIEAFVGAVVVGVKAIGLIYADRLVHKTPLSADDFQGFRHFVHQLNLTQLWAQNRL